MNNKKSIFLILGFLALLVVAYFSKQKHSSLSSKDSLPILPKNSEITRLEIGNKENTLSISLNNEQWLINQQTTADADLIIELLNNLSLLQTHSLVAKQQAQELTEKLKTQGRSIKIFQNKKLVYSLSVGLFNNKDYAISASGKVHFIALKGKPGASIFNQLAADATKWQDKLLINLKPNEIASVIVEYPSALEKGFRIENKNNTTKLYNSQNTEEELLSANAITDYHHFFSGISYERVDTNLQKPDINRHLFRLKINTTVSKVIQIEGFELVDVHTKQPNTYSFAAIVNNSILVELKYMDFDPILVDKDYFLKK